MNTEMIFFSFFFHCVVDDVVLNVLRCRADILGTMSVCCCCFWLCVFVSACVRTCVRVRACVCVCFSVCVRARACVRACRCVCVGVGVWVWLECLLFL